MLGEITDEIREAWKTWRLVAELGYIPNSILANALRDVLARALAAEHQLTECEYSECPLKRDGFDWRQEADKILRGLEKKS